MKKFARFLLWYRLFTKRLFKRPGFVAVLLAVPILTAAMALIAQKDSGIVTIALCCEDSDDSLASDAVRRLTNQPSVLRYVYYDTPDDAKRAVTGGQADAAWIFTGHASRAVDQWTVHPATDGKSDPVVIVVQSNNDALLRLTREKLFAAIYPHVSYSLFRDFVTHDLDAPADETQLRAYYDAHTFEERILVFSYAEGGEVKAENNYLIAPLRGILSLLILLSGLSSGMYCFREEETESFVWLSAGKRRLLPVFCHLTAILPVAIISLGALALGGLLINPWRELLLMLVFSLSAAFFCELVRRLCGNAARLGASIPLLTLAMLALCPIFLNFRRFRALQLLFPPFYYLNAVYSDTFFLWLAGYTLLLAMIVWGLTRLKQE